MPECLRKFRFNDFGPLFVAIDAHGRNLHQEVTDGAQGVLLELMGERQEPLAGRRPLGWGFSRAVCRRTAGERRRDAFVDALLTAAVGGSKHEVCGRWPPVRTPRTAGVRRARLAKPHSSVKDSQGPGIKSTQYHSTSSAGWQRIGAYRDVGPRLQHASRWSGSRYSFQQPMP